MRRRMAKLVVNGATIKCSMGDAPTPLTVTPGQTVFGCRQPAATVMDYKPVVNIKPFGTCKTLTSAASGVPTPCVPATVAPWVPPSQKLIIGIFPALLDSAKCICTVGGVITVQDAGESTIDVSG
jgi:hypothetical protein